MTLIKSISGIRGTIGGSVGEGLSPLDVVKYTGSLCAVGQRVKLGTDQLILKYNETSKSKD